MSTMKNGTLLMGFTVMNMAVKAAIIRATLKLIDSREIYQLYKMNSGLIDHFKQHQQTTTKQPTMAREHFIDK